MKPLDERKTLIGLTLVAALLRLPVLGSPLAGDEAISFNRYGHLPWREILLHYPDTNQHSLFSLLSNFSLWLLGDHEASFRLPCFLAGVLSVPLLFHMSLRLFQSRKTAAVAAALMILSTPHVKYSLEGRGYILTVFLALAMVATAEKLMQGQRRPLWSSLLVLSGTALVLTLPSNVFFVVAVFGYCVTSLWRTGKAGERLGWRKAAPVLGTFAAIFAMTAAYFVLIYSGLRAGLDHHPLQMTAERLLGIAEFLVSPWTVAWIPFLVYGLWALRRSDRFAPLLVLLLLPALLTMVTGIIGFARIYIYYLPFVLGGIAYGLVDLVTRAERIHPKAGVVVAAVLGLFLLVPSLQSVGDFYGSRAATFHPTLAEAGEASSYVEKEIPPDRLIVNLTASPETSVLNHYLGERIRDGMLGIAMGKSPDKIVLIGHHKIPPQEYPIGGYYAGRWVTLPARMLRQVKAIGDLRFYELDVEISRFIPATYDPDREAQSLLPAGGPIAMELTGEPRALGRQSLRVVKSGAADVISGSPAYKTVDIRADDVYLLFVYARRYGQESRSLLAEYDKEHWPPAVGYLNPYLGKFRLPGSDFIWQVVILLSPIEPGRHHLQEILHLKDTVSNFDGFQSFILTRPGAE